MLRLSVACGLTLLIAASAAVGETRNPLGADDWRRLASPEDRAKIADLDHAWRDGLGEARAAGHAAGLRRLGDLVKPQVSLTRPQPSPGAYACRKVKLGSKGGAGLGFVAYGAFRCRVTLSPGGDLRLVKLTGSQRVDGLIFPDGPRRTVLIGGEGLGPDPAPAYGAARRTDVAGVIERIGPDVWRLAIPRPFAEADIELLELRLTGL